jgi:ribose-phosphate pyrophosphokinase
VASGISLFGVASRGTIERQGSVTAERANGSDRKLMLFALQSSRAFGAKVASALGIALSPHEERPFEDGEHKTRPLASVRGADVYVIHSLHGDLEQTASDKLCRLLFFVGALRDSAAASVTAVVPYLAFARKDRKTQPRDPVTTRYVAALFEAVGTDRVMVVDVHNIVAFQNAFRCQTEHLEARHLFAAHFAALLDERPAVVLSPDTGGFKRAERFRVALAKATGRPVGIAFMEKLRALGVVSGETMVGDVAGATVIILDDLIASGGTMLRGAKACRAAGAVRVYAAATHGLFVENAWRAVADPDFDRVVVTDTVPPFRLDENLVRDRLTVLESAGLIAEAIRRVHGGGSIVELTEG